MSPAEGIRLPVGWGLGMFDQTLADFEGQVAQMAQGSFISLQCPSNRGKPFTHSPTFLRGRMMYPFIAQHVAPGC